MRKQISAGGRAELFRAVAERYKQATRGERKTILDELVAITGDALGEARNPPALCAARLHSR